MDSLYCDSYVGDGNLPEVCKIDFGSNKPPGVQVRSCDNICLEADLECDRAMQTDGQNYICESAPGNMVNPVACDQDVGNQERYRLSCDCKQSQNTFGTGNSLSDAFEGVRTSDNSQGLKTITGSQAAVEDNIGAVEVSGILKISDNLDDTGFTSTGPVFIVGGPCINPTYQQLAQAYPHLLDCNEFRQYIDGVARIDFIKDYNGEGDAAILAAGYSADDTRRVTRTVRAYQNYLTELDAASIWVVQAGGQKEYDNVLLHEVDGVWDPRANLP